MEKHKFRIFMTYETLARYAKIATNNLTKVSLLVK